MHLREKKNIPNQNNPQTHERVVADNECPFQTIHLFFPFSTDFDLFFWASRRFFWGSLFDAQEPVAGHILNTRRSGPLDDIPDFLLGQMGFQVLDEPYDLVLGLASAIGMMDGKRQKRKSVSLIPQGLGVLGQSHHSVHQVGADVGGKGPVERIDEVLAGLRNPGHLEPDLGQEDQGGYDSDSVRAAFELFQHRFQMPVGLAYFPFGQEKRSPVVGKPGEIEGFNITLFLNLPSPLVKHSGFVKSALGYRQVPQ
jgi:hypothetical protein